MKGKTKIIRVDGTEEEHPVMSIPEISEAIGAEILDTVNLRDGHVMLVDDLGHVEGIKEVNLKATALYHGVCRQGTTHQIVGDVAIVWDGDFCE